jgi:hypothetical protein
MTHIQISNSENYGSLMEKIILVVNFLFALRVNEIPNKTFILDSHRLFLCSVVRVHCTQKNRLFSVLCVKKVPSKGC